MNFDLCFKNCYTCIRSKITCRRSNQLESRLFFFKKKLFTSFSLPFPPFFFQKKKKKKMSQATSTLAFLFPGNAMVNSLLATSYISIIPNLLLYFVPPNIKPSTLNVLVNFAVGKSYIHTFLSFFFYVNSK